MNWTSSFQPPASTLTFWQGRFGLAGSTRHGVTRSDSVHWQLDNLSIHDRFIVPTSIGANLQLSVHGAVNRLAQGLAKQLKGCDVALA